MDISEYFWLLISIISIVSMLLIKFKTKKHITEKPELKKGYDQYFKWFLICFNAPCLIAGVGNTLGITTAKDYFNININNSIVLIFFFTLIIISGTVMYWIFFKEGAKFIEQHPKLIRTRTLKGYRNAKAKEVKILYVLMLIGFITSIILIKIK